jgi:hypothetical protein
VIDDDEEEEEGRIMGRFNYSECLETGVTAMAPVFLLPDASFRSNERKKKQIPNLI